jgi:hypothetical protein
MSTIIPTFFFDVGNTTPAGAFILARDHDDALAVAIAVGHCKTGKGARVHGPLDISKDSAADDLYAFMTTGRRGRLAKRGTSINGADIIAAIRATGRPPTPPKPNWVFMQEV